MSPYMKAATPADDIFYFAALVLLVGFLILIHQKTIVVINAARAAAFAATAIIVALHWLVSYQQPLNQMVSAYSVDVHYGWAMRSAFILLAIATFGVVVAVGAATKRAREACQDNCHHYTILALVLAGAGIATALMGFFSMHVEDTESLLNHIEVVPVWEGHAHDLFCFFSFTLAALSMLIYAWKPPLRGRDPNWLRAVALVQFNVTLIAVMAYAIMGLADTKSQIDQPEGQKQIAHAQLVPGLGAAERILILLFVEWQFVLLFTLVNDQPDRYRHTSHRALYFGPFHPPGLASVPAAPEEGRSD